MRAADQAGFEIPHGVHQHPIFSHAPNLRCDQVKLEMKLPHLVLNQSDRDVEVNRPFRYW